MKNHVGKIWIRMRTSFSQFGMDYRWENAFRCNVICNSETKFLTLHYGCPTNNCFVCTKQCFLTTLQDVFVNCWQLLSPCGCDNSYSFFCSFNLMVIGFLWWYFLFGSRVMCSSWFVRLTESSRRHGFDRDGRMEFLVVSINVHLSEVIQYIGYILTDFKASSCD